MDWLFIDTHARGTCRLGWLGHVVRERRGERGGVDVRSFEGKTGDLLARLAKWWPKWRQKIKGVCVVAGPGSFSAVRGGVLIANILSRLTGLPLVGVKVGQAADLKALAAELAAGRLSAVAYVAPEYDAAPNITQPRQTCP